MKIKQNNNNNMRILSPYLILALVVVAIFALLNFGGNKVHKISTGELVKAMENDEITEITITPKSSESIFYVEGKLKDY